MQIQCDQIGQFLIKNYVTKVAQTFYECFGYFQTNLFLCKNLLCLLLETIWLLFIPTSGHTERIRNWIDRNSRRISFCFRLQLGSRQRANNLFMKMLTSKVKINNKTGLDLFLRNQIHLKAFVLQAACFLKSEYQYRMKLKEV